MTEASLPPTPRTPATVAEAVPPSKSPRALDAMLAEYSSLRTESLASITNRITVANFAFGAVAVIVAAILANPEPNLTKGLIAVFFVPQIAKAGLLIWLGEYERSQRAGKAISSLETRINDELGRGERSKAMSWESRLIDGGTHMSYPYKSAIYLLLGAGWASTLLGVYNVAFSTHHHIGAFGATGLAVVLLIGAAVLETRFRRFVYAKWDQIRASYKKDAPDPPIL
ncbi:hypothetical protein [Hamadaea tsunoensis]|uniref:hypothetical protein n=1 Tax=Hamadaea tsunoensis TaxID=53368 RepID=UPI000551A9E4|nr:hypothetical protein [Hamadaea tsunoensis]